MRGNRCLSNLTKSTNQMPAHRISMRGNRCLSNLTETMSNEVQIWSFVEIGEELKELSRTQSVTVAFTTSTNQMPAHLINMRGNRCLLNLTETMSNEVQIWSFVAIGEELKELSRTQQSVTDRRTHRRTDARTHARTHRQTDARQTYIPRLAPPATTGDNELLVLTRR
jgi:hypothetical protein